MEQDDGFIQTLPSHMIAEAGAYREHNPRRMVAGARAGRDVAGQEPSSSRAPKIHPPTRDAVQLLDRNGVTVLVRLLFFPQVSRKNLLFKVLQNLCENSKTRLELLTLLLNILQDGTGDLAAVDKSFSQMTVRSSSSSSGKMSMKTAGKQKEKSGSTESVGEALPDLVAQRCLEALSYIVGSNDLSSIFFLTEHELLRRSKKGKGKEKEKQTYYPITVLLGLLDRTSLLRTTAIVESLVGLLATVTRPLTTLKREDEQLPEKDLKSTLVEAQSTESASEPITVEPAVEPVASEPALTEPEPAASGTVVMF
jgi:E3 ubiquitin-protein ligase HUWE1